MNIFLEILCAYTHSGHLKLQTVIFLGQKMDIIRTYSNISRTILFYKDQKYQNFILQTNNTNCFFVSHSFLKKNQSLVSK